MMSTTDQDLGDDQSSINCVDDDSFLANNSICKLHRSKLSMLDSLANEVAAMVRGDRSPTPFNTTTNATASSSSLSSPFDLNNPIQLLSPSPLRSPTNTRNVLSTPINDNNDDDTSTLCSIDNSINNELNALKEVAIELGKELEKENLNTVFEAIERIGDSDDPNVKNVLESEEKDLIKEIIHDEMMKKNDQKKKESVSQYYCLVKGAIIQTFEQNAEHITVLIISILFGLVLKYIYTNHVS